jgi:hypothetical protein
MKAGEKTAARADWRKKNFPQVEGSDQTVLEANTPGRVTREKYERLYPHFQHWADRRGFKTSTHHERDRSLAYYLQDMFFNGTSRDEGSFVVAAVKHFHPQYKAGGTMRLDRATESLKGWARAQPVLPRLPAPKEVMAMLVARMVYKGFRRAANGLWLGVEAYLRPGELCGQDSLVPPLPRSATGKHWAVTLFPREEGQSSKVGKMDEVIAFELDHHAPLQNSFRFLRGGGGSGSLMGMSAVKLHELVVTSGKEAGLESFKLVPYSARHTGPSADIAQKHRDLASVQRRGRWGSDRTVRRYEQSARLLEQLQKMEQGTRDSAIQCLNKIPAVLAGNWNPW